MPASIGIKALFKQGLPVYAMAASCTIWQIFKKTKVQIFLCNYPKIHGTFSNFTGQFEIQFKGYNDMAKSVSYDQQTIDSPNPFVRFAHRSRYKVSLEIGSALLKNGGTIVDFGAGLGTYLAKLRELRPDVNLMAIEPYMKISYEFVKRVDSVEDIQPGTVDLMTAFECLEHVTDEQLKSFLENTVKVLKPGGKLLVTVPIMYGLTLPVKELSRSLLHRRLGDTGPVDMLRATMGAPIARAENRLVSHKGFDFRWLRQEISRYFHIETENFSPFAQLPWWLNSQAIFICSPKI